MAKHYSIGCNYRSGVECTHPQQPHGRKPSNGVCAKVCKLYDGPPVIESRAPEPIPDDYEPTPTNATKGGCGCKK
jgi:hypothetical protein